MLTVADINKAEQNGIPPGTLNTRLQRGWDKERAINEPPRRTKKTYVAYRGGVEICRGSAEECSKKLGIKPETVRWYSTSSYHERIKDRGTQHKSTVVFTL